MDMTFRDGVCRIRTDNAPENLVTLKHMSANLGRRKKGKGSLGRARKAAAWDDDNLVKLISASMPSPDSPDGRVPKLASTPKCGARRRRMGQGRGGLSQPRFILRPMASMAAWSRAP